MVLAFRHDEQVRQAMHGGSPGLGIAGDRDVQDVCWRRVCHLLTSTGRFGLMCKAFCFRPKASPASSSGQKPRRCIWQRRVCRMPGGLISP